MKSTTKAKIQQKLYRATVKVTKNTFSVTFPRQLKEYLKVEGQELYWVPLNGSIQLVGKMPTLLVPALPMDKSAFLAT